MPRPYIKHSTTIEAEPQDVYDLAVYDLQSLSDWLTSVESVESADEGWPALGTSYV